MAKGHISTQQLKSDPLMNQYVKSSEWVKERSRPILIGVIAVAVLAVGILAFRLISSSRADAAAQALAEAYEIDQAVVANPLPPNQLAFTTEEEKNRKAFEAYEKVARNYSSSYGDLARYYAATKQLSFDAPKAEATLKDLSGQNSPVGMQARLALANRYDATGRYNEALAEYQKLKANPGETPLTLVDYHIARASESLGKNKEAADIYANLLTQAQGKPSTIVSQATTRLAALDPARLEQVTTAIAAASAASAPNTPNAARPLGR